MYITREYTTLTNLDGGENITIKPNKPFKGFKGNYKVSSYARIMKDNQTFVLLRAGQIIDGIGEVEEEAPKKKPKSKKVVSDG